ncbi:MAG: hypothetical protein QOI06_2250 [Nocardioidaceae bacterium]|jgi:hypothetical protein|nr:hypothetical protein [Nocardioidaceae bacterium]
MKTRRHRRHLWFGAVVLVGSLVVATQQAGATAPRHEAPAGVSSPSSARTLLGVSAVSGSNAWAVGFTDRSGRPRTSLIEHWDGTRWTVSPSPRLQTDKWLGGVSAASSDNAWAVGGDYVGSQVYGTLIEHWDGTSWTIAPSPNPGTFQSGLDGVAIISPTDAWAVGAYSDSGSEGKTLIEHWDGATWTQVPSPNADGASNLSAVSAVSATDIWAVGSYRTGMYTDSSLIEHWDGTSWTVVPSANPTGDTIVELASVSAVSGQDAWAVGNTYDGITGGTIVEHWDGSTWTKVPSWNAGTTTRLQGVSAISATDAWAVGSYDTNNQSEIIYGTLIEHWDGTTWTKVPSPDPAAHGNILYGVSATSPTKAFAAGRSQTADTYKPLTERWNGATWRRR